MYKEVATWEDGKWGKTTFETKADFKSFLVSIFKEPGKYEFDQTALMFNEQARLWR